MLTLQQFESFELGQIFATGTCLDVPNQVNMTNSGKELRWVAKKGWGHDWAIYVHWSSNDEEWVRDHGDKVTSENHIRFLVPCEDNVFKIYRY